LSDAVIVWYFSAIGNYVGHFASKESGQKWCNFFDTGVQGALSVEHFILFGLLKARI